MKKASNPKKQKPLFSFPLAMLILGIILAIMAVTYFYFTKKSGGIPADRIVSNHGLEKSDWLAFWGCLLGVLSTIVFSTLTWRQNKVLEDINDNNKKQEMELSTLRYTSECYSLLALKHLCFFKNGDGKSAMSLEFDDTGRISPNKLYILNLHVRFKDENDRYINVYSLEKENIDIKNTRSTSGFGSAAHVDFLLEDQQYQEAFSYIVQHVSQTTPYVIVDFECMIKNLMKVTTHTKGQYSLKIVELSQGHEQHKNPEEKALFYVVGSFAQILAYKYSGEADI